VSTPLNNVKVEKERISGVPVNLATAFNSGDMMKWDSTNRVATPMVAGDAGTQAAALAFLGVSNDTNPIANLGQNLPAPRITIITRGIIQFTAGDNATYYPGDAVTVGADPQQVTHTGSSANNIIGYVAPENFFTVTSGASVGIVAVSGITPLLIAIIPGQNTALGNAPYARLATI
jgi:hypothetical protein